MKNYLILVGMMLALGISTRASHYTIQHPVPASATIAHPLSWFGTLSMKQVQKLVGRKLTLKEKIAVKILQWKIKKENRPRKKASSKTGSTALVFGILAFVSILVPAVGLFGMLGFGILAIIFGRKALRADPEDRKAKTATVLGWIACALFIVALVLIAALLSTGGFGWG